MVEQEVEIINQLGLHARAAAKLVKTAGAFRSQIQVIKDGDEVDAKSILGLMGLAACQGTTVTIRCQGDDEGAAFAAVKSLIDDRFEEER